jgi:hypothetical protein
MFDDLSPWFLFNCIFMNVLFVIVPWVVLIGVNPGNHFTINYSVSDAGQLATCQENNQELLDQRDVYCVKEFGRPDNTWEWVLGSLFLVCGAVVYGFAIRRDMRTDERAKEIKQRAAEVTKREDTVTAREQQLAQQTPTKRAR